VITVIPERGRRPPIRPVRGIHGDGRLCIAGAGLLIDRHTPFGDDATAVGLGVRPASEFDLLHRRRRVAPGSLHLSIDDMAGAIDATTAWGPVELPQARLWQGCGTRCGNICGKQHRWRNVSRFDI